MKALRKWLFRYWRWTWPAIALVIMLLVALGSPMNFKGGGGYIAAFVLGYAVLLGYQFVKKTRAPIWFMITMFCIVAVMWGLWLINPGWYGMWRQSSSFVWTIIAILLLSWLSTYGAYPVARAFRRVLTVMLVVILAMSAYHYWRTWLRTKDIKLSAETRLSASVPTTSPAIATLHLPANIVLPIIADCESGDGTKGSARQFADDGTTPIHNVARNSSAIGKYQILENTHGERAARFGHDLRTEAGNEEYAKLLYAERGTQPWDASRDCWQPKLPDPTTVTMTPDTFWVRATSNDWTPEINLPGGRAVGWMPRSAVTYEIATTEETVTFPKEPQSSIAVHSLLYPWFKFRAEDADSVVIDVTSSPR